MGRGLANFGTAGTAKYSRSLYNAEDPSDPLTAGDASIVGRKFERRIYAKSLHALEKIMTSHIVARAAELEALVVRADMTIGRMMTLDLSAETIQAKRYAGIEQQIVSTRTDTIDVRYNARVGGSLAIDTNVSVDGTATMENAAVSGDATVQNLEVNNDAYFHSTVDATNVDVSGNLEVEGDTNLADVHVSADAKVDGEGRFGSLVVDGTVLFSDAVDASSVSVVGNTDTDTLTVRGESTFSKTIHAASVDVRRSLAVGETTETDVLIARTKVDASAIFAEKATIDAIHAAESVVVDKNLSSERIGGHVGTFHSLSTQTLACESAAIGSIGATAINASSDIATESTLSGNRLEISNDADVSGTAYVNALDASMQIKTAGSITSDSLVTETASVQDKLVVQKHISSKTVAADEACFKKFASDEFVLKDGTAESLKISNLRVFPSESASPEEVGEVVLRLSSDGSAIEIAAMGTDDVVRTHQLVLA